jgi:trk system potassium uptake protein TrkA
MSRLVIIGLGHFGATVASALAAAGAEVAAVDFDRAKVQRMANELSLVLVGDGTDPAVLERLGARGAAAAVISTGDDVTASVLVAIALRDLGVRDIHVKVVSELHRRILGKLGVAETVFPERDSALELAHRVGSRAILRYVELEPGLAAQEMVVPQSWIGRSLRELELPRHYGVSVVALRDYLTGETTPIPDPDAPLKESDALLVAGKDSDLTKVAKLVRVG